MVLKRLTILLLLCAGPVVADVTDTLRGASEIYDLTIRENTADTLKNYGGSTTLTCEDKAGADRYMIVYPTDVSAVVPEMGVGGITSAILRLWVSAAEGSCIVEAYELAHPAKEGDNNATTADANESNWSHWSYPDTAWSIRGAARTGTISETYPYSRGGWANFAPAARNPSSNSGWTTGTGGNIYASDDSRGTLRNNLTTITGVATGFGFTIPTGSVVDSIFYTVEGLRSADPGDLSTSQIQPRKSGSGTGDVITLEDILTTSESVHSFGTNRTNAPGTNPLWGTTWTSTDINASTTGLNVTRPVNVDTISIDHITMQVKYHADTTLDRGAAALATDTASGANVWLEFDITDLFASWESNAKNENGVILISTTNDTLLTINSSEHTDSLPMIIFTYDPVASATGARRRKLLMGD